MISPARADGFGEPARTDVCIIGAGPAGLTAAMCAAREGASTLLLEANAQSGRKLLVTGGGRCNFTHAGDANDLIRAFGKAGRFMRHAFHEVQPKDIVAFFRSHGIESKIEPDGSIFPASLTAADIRQTLVRECADLGVRLLTDSKVTHVEAQDAGFSIHTARQIIATRRLVIATGGVSWPQTGSTGDGYRFAEAMGHAVTPPRACLVPLVTAETWPGSMAGVSVEQAAMKVVVDGRKVAVRGSLLFTHDGIGGPAGLDLSRHLADHLPCAPGVDIRIDLIPTLTQEKLDQHLQGQLAANAKKSVVNALTDLLPKRLASVLCDLANCDAEIQANQIEKETRRRLVTRLKELPLCVTGTRPIAEATVTRGGVSTDQIDPRTMQSKIRPGLLFAGEVIDVDGPCGGYNLHACWATGTLAGRSAAGVLSHG
jgi:predicted Rossmann fold flavoprotein